MVCQNTATSAGYDTTDVDGSVGLWTKRNSSYNDVCSSNRKNNLLPEDAKTIRES